MPQFITVTGLNYLPKALVMVASLKAYAPDASVCILLADATPELVQQVQKKIPDIEFIGCDALPNFIPEIRDYYDALEFCSACKILLLDYCIRTKNAPECWFIDPDMLLMGDIITPTRAAQKDIVVTYHTMCPIPGDGHAPTDQEIVLSGIINGGFVYMKNSAITQAALKFMVEKIPAQWFVAPALGMYGDQQWLSLLVPYFNAAVLRHKGINIAYWNLHERPLSGQGDVLTAGGDPALLFHFSGFAMQGEGVLTVHSRRTFDTQTQSVLNPLITRYRAQLAQASERLQGLPARGDIAFSTLPLRIRLNHVRKRHGLNYPTSAELRGLFSRIGARLDRLFA